MTTTTFDSLDALKAALPAAQPGDVLLLAPGSYGTFNPYALQFPAPGVTVGAADPANMPVLAGMEIVDFHGLTLRDIDWRVNLRTLNIAQVYGGERVYFRGGKFHNPEGVEGGAGILIRDSTDCTVADAEIRDCGTAVRINDATHVTISGNHFTDVLGDGIQSSGSSHVTIHRNHLTNFRVQPGDHPDAIQFFTHGEPDPQHHLVITDNVIVRGDGEAVQGIFLGNENGVPYEDVTITGNGLSGTMWNGIALGYVVRGVASDNFVQPYTDVGSALVIDGGSDVTCENNVAGITLITETPDLVLANNVTPPTVEIGDTSDLEAWLAAKNSDGPLRELLKELKRRYDEMAEHLSQCEMKVGALMGLVGKLRGVVLRLDAERREDRRAMVAASAILAGALALPGRPKRVVAS